MKETTNKKLIKRFIPYYYKYKQIFALDMLAAAFTVVSELTLPIIIRNITDISTNNIQNLSIKYLIYIGLIYLLIKLVEVWAHFFMQKNGHIMGAMIEKDMRKEVFTHIQYLSDEFFNNTKIGHLMARITTDLFDITEFAHHCPEEFFVGAIKVFISFIILININVGLTLLMFAMLPLMFILTRKTRKKMRDTHIYQRKHIGEINSNIEDSLLGIKVIKSFANEEVEVEKFEKNNHRFLDLKKGFYTNLSIFAATTRLLDGLMYIVVIFLGGILLSRGKITAGDFIMYIMYASSLLATVTRIVNFMETFEKGMTGIERFMELMEIEPKIKDSNNAIEVGYLNGNIEFENVDFRYKDNDQVEDEASDLVLENVNLKINVGEKIAIVGPSGSGKTTLTNLIPRFYDISKGKIKIDGYNIKDLKLSSLRNNIGMVQQEVYLFGGTIKENISYGKVDASFQEIYDAAKMAGALEFIEALPNGFDTYVGERGVKLSGGQKQRISIARVFLKNPPILILDEATSALDNKSEAIVQASLEKLSKGRTTITIAHRLSTIINSDKILVLTEEGIVESGSHQELLAKKGEYYRLANKVENLSIN